MFNLGQYLHQLLLIHPQVGVPGIGIFSKERIAARYDEQLKKFLPPTSSYSLTPHAATDQHLVNYVAKSLHLSPDEAITAVDKAVDLLLTTVDEYGEAKLEPIGYLKEVEGVYNLVAKTDQKFWGLQPVGEYTVPSVSEELPIVVKEEPDESLAGEQVPETAFETATSEKEGSKLTWLWLTAGIVFIGIIAFFVWQRQESLVQNQRNGTNATAKEVADSLTKQEAPASANVSDTTTSSRPITPVADSLGQQRSREENEPLVRKASKEKPFSIVIGSFKTMKLAIEQAKYFRTIGINAFVLESNMPNNRKKICYGAYATKEAAKEHLEKVRDEITKEAYIFP